MFGPPDVDKLKAKGDVRGLIKAVGYERDAKVRQGAAEALGGLGDARAVQALIAALADRVTEVRRSAIAALGRLRDPRALDPMLAALAEESWSVYSAAVEALGALGDKRAAAPLLAAMGRHRAMVKLETSDALIAIGAPAELLIAALADENVFVRQVAARALGPRGGVEAVEPLIRVLAEPGSWTLGSDAAAALGQIGDSRAVPALVAALQDGPSAVTQAAAEDLGRLGWSPDQGEAGAAYWAAKGRWDHCVELGAVAVRPIGAIIEDNSRLRPEAQIVAAVDTLGQIGGGPAVDVLVTALSDTYTSVRQAAAAALGQLGDPRAVEPLIVALEDGLIEVRKSATDALGQLGGQRALEALVPHLGRQYAGVNSVSAVVQIGPLAVEPLIAVLNDAKRGVTMRLGAASALGLLGDPRAVEPLIAALEDLAHSFPLDIIGALGALGDARATEPLIAKLEASAPEVRREAARALGALGDPRALSALRVAEQTRVLPCARPPRRRWPVSACGRRSLPSGREIRRTPGAGRPV